MASAAIKIGLALAVLLLGAYMGMSYMQIKYGLGRPAVTEPEIPLATLLQNGHLSIAEKNFQCKLDGTKTIATVIADITLTLFNDREKRFSYSCWKNPETEKTSCTLEAKCGLIQNSGCPRTLLSFDAKKEKQIIPDSISCRINGQ